jgi:hypothetical protein
VIIRCLIVPLTFAAAAQQPQSLGPAGPVGDFDIIR